MTLTAPEQQSAHRSRRQPTRSQTPGAGRRSPRNGGGSETATTRSKKSSEVLHQRASQLLTSEIAFIANAEFTAADANEVIFAEPLCLEEIMAANPEPSRGSAGQRNSHLTRMCASRLLTPGEERDCFRRMNFLKFRANQLRSRLNARRPNAELIEQTEAALKEATRYRDAIVQANTRLLVSIAKDFADARNPLDELMSEALLALMRAVESFDYGRGFRFSTYATKAVRRHLFRYLKGRHVDRTRYVTSGDAYVDVAEENPTDGPRREQMWDSTWSVIAEFIDRLDAREQYIIECRYCLGDKHKRRTFQSLADEMGVSKERVRQLAERALKKLTRMAGEAKLEPLERYR